MPRQHSPEIGLIGIGLLGTAIAQRLMDAGNTLRGFDLDPARTAWFAEKGGIVAEGPAEVIAHSQEVILSLPTSRHVTELIRSLQTPPAHGSLLIDTTTGSPDEAREMGKTLAESGVEYLDATILGSSNDLAIGEAILMAGGSDAGFSRARPIIDRLVKKSFHVGPWGAGSKMKLVVNLVLGLNRAVLAEGLSFAESLGFQKQIALEILASGVAYSRVMETKGPRMIAGEFTPQARLKQHHKDVRLMLEQASAGDLQLPLSELHERLLSACIDAGWGDLDNSAIIKFWNSASR